MPRHGDATSFPHLQLLMAIAQENQGEAGDTLRANGFDARGFLSACTQHQLAGFAYRWLQGAGLLGLLPDAVRCDLRLFYQSQLAKNIMILKGTEALSARFRAAGEPLIILKGPLFGLRYYGHIGWRSTGDIDVLVREPGGVRRGHELAESCGFRRRSLVLGNERLMTRFIHHFEYEKGHLRLDLHWALRRHSSLRIDHGRVWETAVTMHALGQEAVVPGDEYALLLHLIGLLDDIQCGRGVLRSIIDVYYLLRKVEEHWDWAAFFGRRREEGTERASVQAIGLVLDSLAAGELPVLRDEIGRRRRLVRVRQPASPFELLGRGAVSISRKLWGLTAYQGSLVSSIAWWGVSLPFRTAACSPLLQSRWSRS
ncbi:MAG: hypothetical protein EHM65_04610 [Acidobacteriales bacterium]|nr:MAG: hypothetical protein EHM65_04610 [Terriglobales bacterium]